MTQEIALDGELLAARGGGRTIAVEESLVTSIGAAPRDHDTPPAILSEAFIDELAGRNPKA